jgi:hypothetical protein
VFLRYEGIAIAAVLAFATEEKPFVTTRKITQDARGFEKDPKLARLPIMMKKALITLIDHNVRGKERCLCTHSAWESLCT